jgi:hypothetical protein
MKFYERFDIKMPIEDAKNRFVNQVHNMIFLEYHDPGHDVNINFVAANTIGKPYNIHRGSIDYLDEYITGGFLDTLHITENIYSEIIIKRPQYADDFKNTIIELLEDAPVDLGITWKNGQFYPTGAKLLDEHLVNESLKWLSANAYSTVLEPFEKGLRHLLHSNKRPELKADCITDMYEAVEALAKIITEKDKDLSANKELFISKLNVSNDYKAVLRGLLNEYIDYGCKFRHAGKKKIPTLNETENYIYLSGSIIRAAIQGDNNG